MNKDTMGSKRNGAIWDNKGNAAAAEALGSFSPAVQQWFAKAFPAGPTDVQRRAWSAVAEGGDVLVVAPTGSGKTLAAFLSAIDKVSAEKAACAAADEKWKPGVRILYISPMKALGADVERNLMRPLEGISRLAGLTGQDGSNAKDSQETDSQASAFQTKGAVRQVTMAMRTGDTTPDERRRIQRKPPDILITTPESLYLMLTSRAREVLETVETVIVDEVHALAPNKRGAHLSLSLERLDELLPEPAQRIGLSATVRPVEEVARFLGGDHEVTVVRDEARPSLDIEVRVPVPDMTQIRRREEGTASIWPYIEEAILDEVEAHSSTIVFVNSRGLCERLTSRLNELYAKRHGIGKVAENADADASAGADAAGAHAALAAHATTAAPTRTGNEFLDALTSGSPDSAGRHSRSSMGGTSSYGKGAPALVAKSHHGSVSKERRAAIERELKTGQLPCVVATSSLELGIDMGDVDLVIQVAPPLSVSSGLQRIGRANHQVGASSHGIILPRTRTEVIDAAVASEGMNEGAIESMRIVANALDVLAQQTVAAVAMSPSGLSADEWFATVRRSANYSGLTRNAFDSVIGMLSGAYSAAGVSGLAPRIAYDAEAGTMHPRPGSQRIAVTGGGTIPDRGLFPVMLPESDSTGGRRRVGELDEEMVAESRVGDVITLGTSTWKITEIGRDRVLVEPAPGRASRLPFWHGEQDGRPYEEGVARGMFLGAAAEGTGQQARLSDALEARLEKDGLDEFARRNLAELVSEQRLCTGKVPTDRTLVVEQCVDETGDWRVILHSPFGRKVHAPWALAISAKIRETLGFDPESLAADDGITLKIPLSEEKLPGAEAFVLDPDEAESLVRRNVETTALFAQRFRECAARALSVTPTTPGKRTPLWQQRLKGAQLLEAAREHEGFPLLAEAARECLTQAYDVEGLRDVLAKVASGDIRMHEVRTATPSPFCAPMLFGYVIEHLYEGDLPQAERRASALAVDPALLGEILGVADASELVDARAVEEVEATLQRIAPWRRLRGMEGAADLLVELGPLSADEVAKRLQTPDAETASAPETEMPQAPDTEAPHATQAEALAFLRGLEKSHRAFPAVVGGRDVWVAAADANAFVEALGTDAPAWALHGTGGVALAKHPLDGIVARFAQTHVPFSAKQAARAFGVGEALVRESLSRLEAAGRLERYGDGLLVTPAVLRRLHARTRAIAEAETEPVGPYKYMDFLLERQGIYRNDAQLTDDWAASDDEAIDILADTIALFEGVYLKPSAWEGCVFPSRVPGYRPRMLDELLESGEVAWRAEVRKGTPVLAFYPTDSPASPTAFDMEDDAGDTAYSMMETFDSKRPENEAESDSEAAKAAVAQALGMLGPARFTALHNEVERTFGLGLSGKDVALALCALAMEGAASCSNFACARAGLLDSEKAASSFLEGTKKPGDIPLSTGGRRATSRRGRHSYDSTASRRTHAEQNVQARRFDAAFQGEWMLLSPPSADDTIRALEIAEGMLDCYGVVARDILLHAGAPGAMGGIYPVLRAMEDAGDLVRGNLVEGMGPAQFASRETVEAMRRKRGAEGAASEAGRSAASGAAALDEAPETATRLAVLSSDDPAWLYGEGVPWPEVAWNAAGDSPALDVARLTVRPRRKDGSRVVAADGRPVLLASPKCKDVIVFDDDAKLLESAFAALFEDVRQHLRRKGVEGLRTKVVVQTLNGIPVNDTPASGMLQDAGLVWVPEGMRLYVD